MGTNMNAIITVSCIYVHAHLFINYQGKPIFAVSYWEFCCIGNTEALHSWHIKNITKRQRWWSWEHRTFCALWKQFPKRSHIYSGTYVHTFTEYTFTSQARFMARNMDLKAKAAPSLLKCPDITSNLDFPVYVVATLVVYFLALGLRDYLA